LGFTIRLKPGAEPADKGECSAHFIQDSENGQTCTRILGILRLHPPGTPNMHVSAEPAIFYLGTPVVLISTLNPDGSTNIAPMSSAWWLGWSCMLGLDSSSQTTENLQRTRECVLNLPAAGAAPLVDRLALLTGSKPVPMHKIMLGYRHAADKFAESGFTSMDSKEVKPTRIAQCPIQLEATVTSIRPFAKEDPRMGVPACAIEVRIVKAHIEESLLDQPGGRKIDPDKWRPLIMSFRRFYGIGESVQPSQLAQSPEARYAPWRSKGPNRLIGMVYRKWAQKKYADRNDPEAPEEPPASH
jgi:flavin reductase (DIM6/NTAB) family NADH-FMN oxidoreductase RutF